MFQNVISCDNNNYTSNIKQKHKFLESYCSYKLIFVQYKDFLEENFSSKSLALFGNFNYFWREWWWWKKMRRKRTKCFCMKKEGVSMYLVVERDRNSIQTQKKWTDIICTYTIFFPSKLSFNIWMISKSLGFFFRNLMSPLNLSYRPSQKLFLQVRTHVLINKHLLQNVFTSKKQTFTDRYECIIG